MASRWFWPHGNKVSPLFLHCLTHILTSIRSGIDAAVKIRPTPTDLAVIGREFEARWANFFSNAPDKPVALVVPVSM